MALESVEVASGTGIDVLVDTTATGQAQVVKLASGTDSSEALIPGDGTDGLLVNLGANNDVTIASLPALAAGTNNIGDVDVLTLPALPAGNNNIGDVDVASIAAGDNNIGNVDIVTMPAVTNAGTFAVQESGAALTALQLIDDGVYTDDTSTHSTGSSKGYGMMAAATPTDASVNANDIGMVAMTTDRKLHVAVMDSLPAGSAAIGKLAANSGVDIGDVDVTSVSGNVTVIQGTATNLKTQSETYQGGSAVAAGNPLQVTLANGSVPSHAVTNAGTFVVQENGSALTALQLIDDVVYTDDTSTHSTGSSKGALIMAAAAPTDAAVNANDIGAVGMTVNRELYVSLTTAIPAGSAAIGKLAANSGVDIGDVDVTSISAGDNTIGRIKLTDGTLVASVRDTGSSDSLNVAIVDGSGNQITSFGGGTQYTEDVAAASDPVGTVPILVRKDTPATVTTTDGDNVAQRGTNYGAAYVQVVTSAGAYVDSFGGGTQYTDDTSTHSTGSSVGNLMMAAATPTDASVNANDIGAVAMTTDRKLHVSVQDALPAGTNAIGKLAANSGVDIGDVDVASVIPGTGATNLGKAEDAGHSSGDVGVMALLVRNDANAAISGNDLDYTPASCDSSGNANVIARRGLTRIAVTSGGLTTTATAYTAGDQVGTQFTFANAARASGGGGTIVGVVLISAADTIGSFDLVVTDSSITLASDNAAYAISDADALKIVGLINLAGAYDIGNNRIAQCFNLAVPYVCSGGTSLYGGLITRSAIAATPFAATTDIQVNLLVELN